MYKTIIRQLFPLFVFIIMFAGACFNGPGLIVGLLSSIALHIILNMFFGKHYSGKNICGFARDSINFTNSNGYTKKELLQFIKNNLKTEFLKNNVPARITVSTLKIGNPIFGKVVPMILVKNTSFGCKFYDIGLAINGKTTYFPLVGESKEIKKYNLRNIYSFEEMFKGGYTSFFYNPDMGRIAQEEAWRASVIQCFENAILE